MRTYIWVGPWELLLCHWPCEALCHSGASMLFLANVCVVAAQPYVGHSRLTGGLLVQSPARGLPTPTLRSQEPAGRDQVQGGPGMMVQRL